MTGARSRRKGSGYHSLNRTLACLSGELVRVMRRFLLTVFATAFTALICGCAGHQVSAPIPLAVPQAHSDSAITAKRSLDEVLERYALRDSDGRYVIDAASYREMDAEAKRTLHSYIARKLAPNEKTMGRRTVKAVPIATYDSCDQWDITVPAGGTTCDITGLGFDCLYCSNPCANNNFQATWSFVSSDLPGITFSHWQFAMWPNDQSPGRCIYAWYTFVTVPPDTPPGTYHYLWSRNGSTPSVPNQIWVTAPSTPTPPPTPPAPAAPKSIYTASEFSKGNIPLSDAASAGQFGTLSWTITADSTQLRNVKLNAATTVSPHSNVATFSVPFDALPGDYHIKVLVRSSQTGTSSSETNITLRVLRPTVLESDYNWLGVYQEDSSGNIVQSDGSQFVISDPGVDPDFPLDISNGAAMSTSRGAVSRAAAAPGFDAMKPPQDFAKALESRRRDNGCAGLLVDDNTAHDKRSGNARGTIQLYVYCSLRIPYGLRASWDASAVSMSSLSFIGDKRYPDEPCAATGQRYNGVWEICKTAAVPVSPVSGHAERDTFYFTLLVPNSGPINSAANATFWVNNKGVFYPRVPVETTWGSAEKGVVPFPDGLIVDCRVPSAQCFKGGDNSGRLRKNLRAAGFERPHGDFEAHHVQPLRWGGDDACDRSKCNGVWLPRLLHREFTTWWDTRNFSV